MANSRSARKQIRASERKRVRNRTVRSSVRTSINRARRLLLGGEVTEPQTQEQVLLAVRALDRAAEKGILHRNNADRRKSRLMAMASRLVRAAEGAEGDEAAARTAAAGGQKGRSRKAAAGSKAAAAKRPARPKTAASTRASKPAPKSASTTSTAKPASTGRKRGGSA